MGDGEHAQASADVREVLRRDFDLQVRGVADPCEGSPPPSAPAPRTAGSLSVRILTDTEHYQDHLITQLELIEELGLKSSTPPTSERIRASARPFHALRSWAAPAAVTVRPASRFSHPVACPAGSERRWSSGRCRSHGSRRCRPGDRPRRRGRFARPRPRSASAGPRTSWR